MRKQLRICDQSSRLIQSDQHHLCQVGQCIPTRLYLHGTLDHLLFLIDHVGRYHHGRAFIMDITLQDSQGSDHATSITYLDDLDDTGFACNELLAYGCRGPWLCSFWQPSLCTWSVMKCMMLLLIYGFLSATTRSRIPHAIAVNIRNLLCHAISMPQQVMVVISCQSISNIMFLKRYLYTNHGIHID